jgi:hypothetical protein
MAQPLKGTIIVTLRMSMIIYYYVALSRLGFRKRSYTRHLHIICMSLLKNATITVKHVEETATEILILKNMPLPASRRILEIILRI